MDCPSELMVSRACSLLSTTEDKLHWTHAEDIDGVVFSADGDPSNSHVIIDSSLRWFGRAGTVSIDELINQYQARFDSLTPQTPASNDMRWKE